MELTHTFTLANGRQVNVDSGDPLPHGLPQDFSVQLIPEEIMKSVNQPIFIGTTLKALGESIEIYKKHTIQERLQVLYGATKCVNEFMPRCDEVYSKMSKDKKAAQEWQDFCDDIGILASYRIASGRDIRVLLEHPTVSKTCICGACYVLNKSHFLPPKKLSFKNKMVV